LLLRAVSQIGRRAAASSRSAETWSYTARVSEVPVALPIPGLPLDGLMPADRHAVPDAVAPPPRHPRFPLIDGMRALAVLGVVVVHSAVAGGALSGSLPGRLLAHLNLGVTVFFLISGFLLYRPFIAHKAGGAAAPAVGDYAKRRVLRIYPAYWLVLTALVIVPGVTGVVGGHWWPMYGLVHTLPLLDCRDSGCVEALNSCGLAQTWSLVVELTFYLVLPLYAMALARLTRRTGVRGWMTAELLVLTLLSACSVVLQYRVLDPASPWMTASVAGYVLWFALGMGMAVASVGFGGSERPPWALRAVAARPGVVWALAFTAYVAMCTRLPPSPFLFTRGAQLESHLASAAIAALLLAPAVFADRPGRLPHRVLARPVIAWLGLVSYGIFLWHYAVTLVLGFNGAGASFGVVLAGTLAISVPCAAASYRLVERPVLALKHRRLRDVRARAA
jgi:peptidoglycan/LPS O-acetylase OafA/YrhL